MYKDDLQAAHARIEELEHRLRQAKEPEIATDSSTPPSPLRRAWRRLRKKDALERWVEPHVDIFWRWGTFALVWGVVCALIMCVCGNYDGLGPVRWKLSDIRREQLCISACGLSYSKRLLDTPQAYHTTRAMLVCICASSQPAPAEKLRAVYFWDPEDKD